MKILKTSKKNPRNDETVGERIRRLRRALDMTQGELAELTGYTGHTSIAAIEAGTVSIGIDRIPIIAKILGVTPSALAGWENETPKQTGDK